MPGAKSNVHCPTLQKKNGGIVMVSLSVGVLQCNPLANVSTVAGKLHPGLSEQFDLDLKQGPTLRTTSEGPQGFDPPVDNRHCSPKPNDERYTVLSVTWNWSHRIETDADGYPGGSQTQSPGAAHLHLCRGSKAHCLCLWSRDWAAP